MHDGHEIAEYMSYVLSDGKQRIADRVKARRPNAAAVLSATRRIEQPRASDDEADQHERRVLHARTAAPSMRMPHEPQIIIRQLLRYASEPST